MVSRKIRNYWILTEVGIDPKRRGETLSIEEFATLSNALVLHKLS